MADSEAVILSRKIRQDMAREELTPSQAKLYSQRIRLEMGSKGLASFSAEEALTRLEESILLIEAGWLERNDDGDSSWKQSFKRAGEILEWLSQPSLKPEETPVHLLSAAAFQVAGYPALALGQLNRTSRGEPVSDLLVSFIKADFPGALNAARIYWAKRRAHEGRLQEDERGNDLGEFAQQEVVRCLGTICAYMRSGKDSLKTRALEKLGKLAAIYLHSRDPYSYLLARLTAGVAEKFCQTSLWPHVETLSVDSDPSVRAALAQFARVSVTNRRALVWPSQVDGVERLSSGDSFVLCTPTGAGKTTIATLAAVQGLFANQTSPSESVNLILYLVPSRALAAEVEARLASDLSGLAVQPVVVTGLYGGIDWGPTDAWISTEQPTVVVCTYEKADALLRYLGPLFLDRVRTVVIDEAHTIEHDPSDMEDVASGTSRALRLENLSARLLRARDKKGFRIIALSAVAASAAPAIASCYGDEENAEPIVSTHRSTRQMVGSLEVSRSGRFEIRYELMDGHSLAFEDERPDDRPFVRDPFPPLPGEFNDDSQPEVSIRAPTLWAALHLAHEHEGGDKPTVLISITQNISTFAETCVELMDEWEEQNLPNYWSAGEEDSSWQSCLSAAEDYFTKNSFEYRLLKHRIALYHGQMPALLARRLKVAIEKRRVRVVIATSSLSEGVNLPVNTILLPSVFRGVDQISAAEFSNLIGRAGRPGVTTEGSALVVLPQQQYKPRQGRSQRRYRKRQWNGYDGLIGSLRESAKLAAEGDTALNKTNASSALAVLMSELRAGWKKISGSENDEDFVAWLEDTSVDTAEKEDEGTAQYLDSLDAILLATLQEVESLTARELEPADLEAELIRIWRHTYAHAAYRDEARLAKFWLARGGAIKDIYPDANRRRRIYRTSLGPRSGEILLENAEAIRKKLISGADYANRSDESQLDFIKEILERLSAVPDFAIERKLGRNSNFDDWPKILHWWLSPSTLSKQPTAKELSTWYKFVSGNFIYRGSWGIGSLIGVLFDLNGDGKPIDALKIEDWPAIELPWIAFWMKELLNWGTLDPVVAFLLARGKANDRQQAAKKAEAYHESQGGDVDPNGILDPRRIRDWFDETILDLGMDGPFAPMFFKEVKLERSREDYLNREMNVLPIQEDDRLAWIDPAGYLVAYSECPEEWSEPMATEHTFTLTVDKCQIARDLPNL